MNPRELVDRVRKAVLAFVSRLSRKGRISAPPGAEAEEDDGLAGLLAGSPKGDVPAPSGFPGFAPPPSLGDRIRSSAADLVERIRGNPRALLAAGVGFLCVGLAVLVVALVQRPPKPVVPRAAVSQETLEILRRIPVPRPDPLAEESALDRPRKDRYTEEEAARMWIDLGLLSTDSLRERNRAELKDLLSAMEKR